LHIDNKTKMDFQTYSKKVALVEKYIKNKWANTPATIAKKLKVSERTVLRMINYLKKDGKQIEYCKKEKIYKIF
jgi:Mn-dependent DtxR family transcriptional regulator